MTASPVGGVKTMEWPEAQRAILDGKKIRRESWLEPSVYIVMTDGYLKIRHASGACDALIVCEADLLAQDWVVVVEH